MIRCIFLALSLYLWMSVSPLASRAQPSVPIAEPPAPDAQAPLEEESEAVPSKAQLDADAALAEIDALKNALEEQAATLEQLEEQMLIAEEEALTSQIEESDTEIKPLAIYGFIEAAGRGMLLPSDFGLVNVFTGEGATFMFGAANFYFDAQPSPNWRALLETRFTLYPNGSTSIDSSGRVNQGDTSVLDENSASGRNTVRWSGNVLERSWVQWMHSDHLKIRAGFFLTPHGIWNMDHGTPTLISQFLPSAQIDEAIPHRQLGVQINGIHELADYSLAYWAYLGNGRTIGVRDDEWGKDIGGRLTLSQYGETRWTLGTSWYLGDTKESKKQLDFASDPLRINTERGYELTERSLGFDLSVDMGNLRVRSEALLTRRTYPDGHHEPVSFGRPGNLQANTWGHHFYGLVAYRMGIYEPYVFFDVRHQSPGGNLHDTIMLQSVGWNIHFEPWVQLKTQIARAGFANWQQDLDVDLSTYPFVAADVRLVLSF